MTRDLGAHAGVAAVKICSVNSHVLDSLHA